MDIVTQLMKRLRYDKKGIDAETASALRHNQEFMNSLISEGNDTFLDPHSGNRFKISFKEGKKSMTRILPAKEVEEINSTWPKEVR